MVVKDRFHCISIPNGECSRNHGHCIQCPCRNTVNIDPSWPGNDSANALLVVSCCLMAPDLTIGRISRQPNYADPVYGVATICHQVRWLRWGHPSLFHTATSLLIWYKIFCVRDISYILIRVEFINILSVYAQSGTHSRFNWWIVMVVTYNPSVLMCVEISDTPKL